MGKAYDIELINNDLLIKAGDFVINESDQKHIEDILLFGKGSVKHSPITGLGIVKYVNARNTADVQAGFKRKVKIQLEYDGYDNIETDTKDGIMNVKITANRI
jgi:hypothetical protein